MGYDLHITRADHWSESRSKRISILEWLVYLDTDPELELATAGESKNEQGETIQVMSFGMAIWRPAPNRECCFEHDSGHIIVKNPDEHAVAKMREIAAHLRARVQGDDGEWYE